MSPELFNTTWWEWVFLATAMTIFLYTCCSNDDDPPGVG